jgi:hypothetical protein
MKVKARVVATMKPTKRQLEQRVVKAAMQWHKYNYWWNHEDYERELYRACAALAKRMIGKSKP